MGISVSWVAGRGQSRADFLAMLGLEDTGVPDPQVQRPCSIANLADGWFIIQARSFDWAPRQSLAELSVGGEAIAVQEEEHVMVSTIRVYRDGQPLWSIEHEGGE